MVTVVPVAFLLVLLTALVVATPASLVIGAPLSWAMQRLVLRWPLAGVLTLALIGMVSAIPINGALNNGDAQHDLWVALLFGGLVAGAHGVVLVHRTTRSWPRTLAMGALATVLGSAAGRVVLDELNDALAARAMAGCRHYDFASRTLAPEALATIGKAGHRVSHEQGPWSGLWQTPGLYGRYSALFIDGRRTLVAEDMALVPIRPWHRLGWPRIATAQCLTTLTGPDAALLRRAGLVQPFRWAYVEVH